MRSFGWGWIVWGLLGLLVISAGSLSMGRRESTSFPSASSFGPSGVKAFSDLLREQGYQVSVDVSPRPALRPTDTAVAFWITGATGPFGQIKRSIMPSYTAHLTDGGGVILFTLPSDFDTVSKKSMSMPTVVQSALDNSAHQLSLPGTDDNGFEVPVKSSAQKVLLTRPGDPSYAALQRIGSGHEVIVANGLPVTNRFIDKLDNAAVMLSLVRTVANPGSRIVFVESSFGNTSEPSLMELIGPWALASWWQILFLLLVIGYTVGARFGIAEEDRSTEKGGRELVDALAQTYRRARATHIAIGALLQQADRQVRKKLKLSRDAPASVRDDGVPSTVARSLYYAQNASHGRIPADQALSVARDLDRHVGDFLGKRQVKMRKRKFRH